MAQNDGDVQDPVRQDLIVFSAIKEIGRSVFDRYENGVRVMVSCCGPGSATIRLVYGWQQYIQNQKSRWLIKIC